MIAQDLVTERPRFRTIRSMALLESCTRGLRLYDMANSAYLEAVIRISTYIAFHTYE